MNYCFNSIPRFFLLLTLALLTTGPSRVLADTPTVAIPGKVFSFPQDHGSHPDFKTEWWYFTGNLYAPHRKTFSDVPSYGYQLTFFRQRSENGQQNYLAHAAISDFSSNKHYVASLTSPESFSLAGADSHRLNVWNRNWSAKMINDQIVLEFTIEGKAFDLVLDTSNTPQPILQGDQGFSKKGACESCASYYTSYTRLESKATLVDNKGSPQNFSGISWMDHEYMSNTLQSDQIGWDWFSLITKNNSEVMLFRVRGAQEGKDFFAGSCVKNGIMTPLNGNDFRITDTDHWQSPNTNTRYPNRWNIEVPICDISSPIKTRIPDQEMNFSEGSPVSYYEGAIVSPNESIIGYVEMTGYNGKINGL